MWLVRRLPPLALLVQGRVLVSAGVSCIPGSASVRVLGRAEPVQVLVLVRELSLPLAPPAVQLAVQLAVQVGHLVTPLSAQQANPRGYCAGIQR